MGPAHSYACKFERAGAKIVSLHRGRGHADLRTGDGGHRKEQSGDEAPFLEKAGWKRLGIVALTLVLYYFGLEYIGFLIMTPIFAFAVIMILSSGKKINRILAVIVAVLTTVILYLLFQKVFADPASGGKADFHSTML
ncbi:MAG: tripartite tricarboxylate transporter TctB family protein [Enterocloster clostridioformis]